MVESRNAPADEAEHESLCQSDRKWRGWLGGGSGRAPELAGSSSSCGTILPECGSRCACYQGAALGSNWRRSPPLQHLSGGACDEGFAVSSQTARHTCSTKGPPLSCGWLPKEDLSEHTHGSSNLKCYAGVRYLYPYSIHLQKEITKHREVAAAERLTGEMKELMLLAVADELRFQPTRFLVVGQLLGSALAGNHTALAKPAAQIAE